MTHGEGAAQAAAAVNFDAGKTLPIRIFDEITEIRVRRPNVVEQEANRRRRRTHIAPDGRLVLVAVDHPARGVTQIRKEELAMGDRYQLLARTRRVFDDPHMDGIVATADILEELLYLSHLERKKGGKSFLDGRVLVGTMNRGGLAGTAFEMDDTFTGMTAKRIAELRLDGGKMMFRLDPADAGSRNQRTSEKPPPRFRRSADYGEEAGRRLPHAEQCSHVNPQLRNCRGIGRLFVACLAETAVLPGFRQSRHGHNVADSPARRSCPGKSARNSRRFCRGDGFEPASSRRHYRAESVVPRGE